MIRKFYIIWCAVIISGVLADGVASQTNSGSPLALAQRKLLDDTDRLRWLDRNGAVPPDADALDWELATKTAWWGKRVDPAVFWAKRTIWLDGSAINRAHRFGRHYPPLPYAATDLNGCSDKDTIDDSSSVEVDEYPLHGSYRELVFWARFVKTHPRPPEDFKMDQMMLADLAYKHSSAGSRVAAYLPMIKNTDVQRAINEGLPPEAFGDDALYWYFVDEERKEYQMFQSPAITPQSPILKHFFEEARAASIDPKLITEPLGAAQERQANAWKIAYLNRLRREKTDESYISAYLAAWKLSADMLAKN